MELFIIIIIISALLLLTFVCILGRYFFRQILIRKNRVSCEEVTASQNTDNWKGLKPELLYIKSHDGLKLTGYYIPAVIKTNRLVVFVHGYTSSAFDNIIFAQEYHKAGYNFFAFDHRAHGDSEGEYISMGQLECKDLIKWLYYLLKKFRQDTQIILHGVSMGGAVVCLASSDHKLPSQVTHIISDCAFTSAYDEFRAQIKNQFHLPPFPFVDIMNFYTNIFYRFSLKKPTPEIRVRDSETPVLFIHGSEDTFVPTKMVYRLFEQASCRKELYIAKDAAHAESINVNTEEYMRRVLGFLSKADEKTVES